ncbi:MAG: hypothetical protein WC009_02535 [Methylotenera sp.]
MLNQKLAEAMQRILSKHDERFTLTVAMQDLIDAGLGTKRGKSAHFTAKDKAEMRTWLQAKGFTVEQVNLSGMNRSERLTVTPLEKAGGEAIKRNRVSIKALAGEPLLIGEGHLKLPTESHLDVDWTKIADKIGHQCVMVVENYENFNRVHELALVLPDRYQSPLVIYRGDPNESRFDNVLKFCTHIDLPVLAFMDADPAGIAIACQLPGLIGMILPSLDVLESQLSNQHTARIDLFHDQYPVYGRTLERLDAGHPCKPVWDLVSKHAAGVVQERWITGCICTLIAC